VGAARAGNRGEMAEEERRARFVDGALEVHGRRIPLRSGSVQYFRLERAAWRPALEAVRAAGIGMVETYVPWGVHEREPGVLDFGTFAPENDLGAFLDLAHELGLYVFLRPGPHINAELTYFGLPARIVADEACWARSPRDTPVYLHTPPRMFPVPSFASRRFREEAERWLAAVAEVAAPRAFPDGPVVMLQIDNEPCLYFRNGAYDQDYHPDAQVKWRRFLRERYETLDALREAHSFDYGSFDHAEPPARFEPDPARLPRHLDWTAFQEALVTDAMRHFANALGEHGLGDVPTVLNVPIGEAGIPVSYGALAETADLVGFDYYHSASSLEIVRRRTQLLRAVSALPFAPELGVGSPPFILPLSDDDSFQTALAALAFGLRGMNLYMLVDRDRWIGAPIDAEGKPRPSLDRWSSLLRALEAARHETLEHRVEVAIVLPIEYRRLSRVTSMLGPLSPQLFDALAHDPTFGCRMDTLGFELPIQLRWWQDVTAIGEALDRRGIPFDYVPSELEGGHLERYRYVFSPSFEICSDARFRRLTRAARAGAQVAIGPREPSIDDRGRPSRRALGTRMSLVDTRIDGWADTLVTRWVDEHGVRAPFRCTTPGIHVAMHEDREGPRVVFVVNTVASNHEAVLDLPAPGRFEDALDGEVLVGGPQLVVPMRPCSVRMLVCERDGHAAPPPAAPAEPPRSTRPSARARKKGTR
jgi:beta-galactosidase